MPWTIFKDAIRRRAYAVNGRIRGRSEPALEAATMGRPREGRGGEGGRGVALKDARGHEDEKGERVEDRKCTSVGLMRARERDGTGWKDRGGGEERRSGEG